MNENKAKELLNKMADVECELFYFMDRTNDEKFEEVRKNLKTAMEQFYELTK